MKQIRLWILATILACGASVFTSCTENSDNALPQTAKDRKEFLAHVKTNMKYLAENLNFGSWQMANQLNQEFNAEVLNNPEFDKTVSSLFNQKIRESIRPVDADSELAQKGYKYVATIDFTEFNYRFTQRLDLSGFDVEEADDFEVLLQDDVWEPGTIYHIRLLLKAGGDKQKLLSGTMTNDSVAVVMLIPEDFEFSISSDYYGYYMTQIRGTFKNSLQPMSGSQYATLAYSRWTIGGTISTDIHETDWNDEYIEDKTNLDFTISQNPVTHQSDVDFAYVHNGRNMVQLQATNTNLNGKTNLSLFTSGNSLLEVLGAIFEGNSIDNLKLTLNDDLVTTLKITDCAKALGIAVEASAARRSYADQATIDQYTQALNQIVSATLICKGVSQTIPMELQTVRFGVDWWTMPALNFADENGYVPFNKLVEAETMEYAINIIDHAAEPMAQSAIVVRQLLQYLQTLFGSYKQAQ